MERSCSRFRGLVLAQLEHRVQYTGSSGWPRIFPAFPCHQYHCKSRAQRDTEREIYGGIRVIFALSSLRPEITWRENLVDRSLGCLRYAKLNFERGKVHYWSRREFDVPQIRRYLEKHAILPNSICHANCVFRNNAIQVLPMSRPC